MVAAAAGESEEAILRAGARGADMLVRVKHENNGRIAPGESNNLHVVAVPAARFLSQGFGGDAISYTPSVDKYEENFREDVFPLLRFALSTLRNAYRCVVTVSFEHVLFAMLSSCDFDRGYRSLDWCLGV